MTKLKSFGIDPLSLPTPSNLGRLPFPGTYPPVRIGLLDLVLHDLAEHPALERNRQGLLMMPANQPVLRIKSVNVNPQTGTPVEYSITRFRADRVQLRLDLDESGSFTNPIPHGDMQ